MSYLLGFTTILVFALHLVAMNVASAGPLASMVLDWRKTDRTASHAAARYLAGTALLAYLVGMLLGLGLMLLAWNADQTKRIFALLEHKIYYGVIELGFSLVLMVVYYAWLRVSPINSAIGNRVCRSLFALMAATNLLYHFPPLFAVAAKIADGRLPATEPITPALFRAQLVTPDVASQSVHFALASLAAAGIMLMAFSLRWTRESQATQDEAKRLAKIGGRLSLVPTLLQVLVGVWVLLSLPSIDQQRLMGGDLTATGLFLLSLASALGLMHALASIAIGDWDRMLIVRAMAAFGMTVVLMTAVLYSV